MTVPITASCWIGVVDKVGAAMSEACEWLRGTPTSATSENENAAVCATSTTSTPSAASTSAQARPIPFDAPVTSAFCCANRDP